MGGWWDWFRKFDLISGACLIMVLLMRPTFSNYYKRIIRRQIRSGRFNNEDEVLRHSLSLLDTIERAAGPAGSSFSSGRELEGMLLAGLDSGKPSSMTAQRRRRIYGVVKKR